MNPKRNTENTTTPPRNDADDNGELSELNESSRESLDDEVDTNNDATKGDSDSVLSEINGPAEDKKD